MDGKQTFETVLIKHGKMEATGIEIPFNVEAVFGAKRVPVKAMVNGAEYRGSIVRMGGKYLLGIPKAFRDEAGIAAGDNIVITIERDTQERVVEIPPDLAATLKEQGLTAAWERLSFSHRKEHARAIAEAKRPETRQKRIESAVRMIGDSKR